MASLLLVEIRFPNLQRPIVEFSIENKHALNVRESRIAKSKLGKQRQQQQMNETNKDKRRTFPDKKPFTALDDTKRVMRKAGMKPLPSHLGPKMRHRDRKENKGKKAAPKTQKNNVVNKKAKWKKSRKQLRSEKGRQKMVAKYLTIT